MNAAETLAGEIERVACLFERYRCIRALSLGQTNVEPVMGLIRTALNRAKLAAGSNDAVEVIAAIQDLEGFTS